MKIRIFFRKTDEFKYISHLDIIRFFERLFRKSQINVAYTQGYHPRPKLSFGYPVPLGVESLNEPVDIELARDYDVDFIKENLNDASPKGFHVLDVIDKTEKSKIVEDYSKMIYEIVFHKHSDIEKMFNKLSQESIIENRRKKRKIITRDLKEKVVDFKIENGKIYLTAKEISPKPIINVADISEMDVDITRIKYI